MNSSEQSIERLGDPTFFLEGVVREKSDMVDFEGPLSLILLLLSKNKIEIRDISVSDILDQYLAYLAEMEKLDLEIASEFVQMASYLLYIKTRMLLTEEKEISELEQLIASLEQLKAKDTYTALKSVTPMLEAASRTGLQYFSRLPEPLPKKTGEYRYSIEAEDLLRGLLTVFTRPGASAAEPASLQMPRRIVYSVRRKSRDILDLLRAEGSMTLSALYQRCESRSELVATFLSVLELCSMGSLLLSEQDGAWVAGFAGGEENMTEILDSIAESVGEEEDIGT